MYSHSGFSLRLFYLNRRFMKGIVCILSTSLILGMVIIGCAGKDKGKIQGFNGFAWGTAEDSIIYAVGREPKKRLRGGIEYRDGTYESMTGDQVNYFTPGGRLTGGNFFKFSAKKSEYDALYNIYVDRYGKGTKNKEGAYVWTVDDTEVSILYAGGTIMAVANRVPLKR